MTVLFTRRIKRKIGGADKGMVLLAGNGCW